MRITIRLGDPLWRNIGTRRLELVLDGDEVTIAQALDRLADQYPDSDLDLLPDGNSARHHLPYYLFLNDRKIAWDKIGQTPLHDGDQLVLFLIVIGG